MLVTTTTGLVALGGLLLISLLLLLQGVAVLWPRSEWVVKNVYGGTPAKTDPQAYFAFNQGFALADVMFLGPQQLVGSIGMLLGERWGFLFALMAAVPFCYSAIQFFVWDRDMGFRRNTFSYWFVVWGMFPLFGVIEMVYCFARLM